ncbi:MAG TPA: family 43 glycosylhydrolase [Verrucomicrobiae bacterium]
MKKYKFYLLAFGFAGLFFVHNTRATNPIILDQFTADPTARVFEGKIYLYPSHDIPVPPGSGARQNWFCMEDYHVFSSENLTDWEDHGVICNQTNVPWLNRKGYDMWAPDCVFKNGTYYFYFPVGGRIGVATSDKPDGPWKVLDQPVAGVGGIDPCVLQDDDGSAYLFTAAGGISVSKLNDNMVAVESRPQRIANLPRPGLIEGPFAFKRNGIYYLTYPHAVPDAAGRQGAEELEYSISTNVFGPYKWMGVITDTNKSGCWTEHHSIVQYKGQWYLFYHDKQLSPNFDKNRSVRVDYLHFNDDGTIQKVIPTLRGVGIVDAKSKIQIDRYSDISKEGVTDSFLNPTNTFEGWKISLNGKNTWVQFDRVDFGQNGLKSVNVRAASSTGGSIEIRLDKVDGPVLAKVEIGKNSEWNVVNAKLHSVPTGVHDLVVTQNEDANVDLDWISFE